MLNQYQRVRIYTVAAVLACYLLFAGASRMMGIPATRGFEISLTQQPNPFAAFLGVAVLLIVATLIGTIIAGTIRFEAGLFAATLGLMAISMRGGTMGTTLRAASSPSIYIALIFELIFLYAIVVVGWLILNVLHRRGLLLHDEYRDFVTDEPADTTQKISVTATASGIMILLMLFFAQSAAKNQALASVFISAFVGAYAAYSITPIRGGIWYWLAPLIVGIVGYATTFISPDGWNIGQTHGFFGGLAKPLPIDYASVGPAGAILGYWIGRNGRSPEESELAAIDASIRKA